MSDLKMYLIERENYSYDETASAVVAAKDVREARELMKTAGGDQGPDAWAPGKATVTLIGTARTKTPKVIHEYFAAG